MSKSSALKNACTNFPCLCAGDTETLVERNACHLLRCVDYCPLSLSLLLALMSLYPGLLPWVSFNYHLQMKAGLSVHIGNEVKAPTD